MINKYYRWWVLVHIVYFYKKNKLISSPKIPLSFFFLVIFLVPINSIGQIFQRVENSIGLGKVEKNNGFSVADYDKDGDLDRGEYITMVFDPGFDPDEWDPDTDIISPDDDVL